MKTIRGTPFFAGVWAGMAPLLVWAAHFAFSYVAVAAVCWNALRADVGDPPMLRWTLAGATALALVTLATMLWRARAPAARASYLQVVRQVGTMLALIAVLWSGVPVALLPACRP